MNSQRRPSTFAFALVALCAVMLPQAVHAEQYTITVEDLVVGGPDTGQPLSPPVAAVHDAGYTMWEPGGMASPGLEIVARDGNPMTLEAEAMASPNVFDVAVGDGPFFDSVEFSIEGDPGQLLSIACMLGRTNDLITGIHDVALPAADPIEMETTAYDAGVEENTGLAEHIPFYGNPGVGPDESMPIEMISLFVVHNDPMFGELTWTFPPAANITVELTATPVEASTWGAIKSAWID
jgi:hypothetical protein